jgi:hypothetical protein
MSWDDWDGSDWWHGYRDSDADRPDPDRWPSPGRGMLRWAPGAQHDGIVEPDPRQAEMDRRTDAERALVEHRDARSRRQRPAPDHDQPSAAPIPVPAAPEPTGRATSPLQAETRAQVPHALTEDEVRSGLRMFRDMLRRWIDAPDDTDFPTSRR